MMDVELQEHGPEQVVDGLPAPAVSILREVLSVYPAGPNRWTLKPRGKVGVIRIGDVTVRIRPKVITGHLLFLMGYAKKSTPWQDSLAGLAEAGELVATVADAFSRLAEQALRGGVMQAYRPIETTLPVLRGRIRMAAQLRTRYGAALPLEVGYEEFGLDIPENRLLKAAAQKALRLPRLRPESERRLRWISHRLADVSAPDRAGLPSRSVTRLTACYQQALDLTHLVLRGSSFALPSGMIRAEGFILDMHVIFEDFLCTALTEALTVRVPGEGRSQHIDHLDLNSVLTIKPDFTWLVDGKPALIVDAKYKADAKNKPEDVYQMLAYCSALGLPAGHLVYVGEGAGPRIHDIRSCGVRIVRHTLDLSLPPPQLLLAIGELADQVAAEDGLVKAQ